MPGPFPSPSFFDSIVEIIDEIDEIDVANESTQDDTINNWWNISIFYRNIAGIYHEHFQAEIIQAY